MKNHIDSILLADSMCPTPAEPDTNVRLTVAQVFNTYQRMHDALDSAMHYSSQVPAASPGDCAQHLKDVIKQCEGAIKHANRMLEANR